MKNYDKLLKEIRKKPGFLIIKASKRNHYKIKHIKSNTSYTSHPGEAGYKPLKRWFDKINYKNKRG